MTRMKIDFMNSLSEIQQVVASAGIYIRSCFYYVELIASQLTGNDSLSVELRHCP